MAKVNAAGSALSYCGYIGGSGDDEGFGIAVGTTGNAYMTGYTTSTQATFPETVGPDLTHNGGTDAFVAKLTTAGALSYCGYVGGSATDWGEDVAIDSSENAYLTGETYSLPATFPVAVGPDLTYTGSGDAFVAKVNSAGTVIVYCGYLGGSSSDTGYNIAVDARGNAYITGPTDSDETTLPVLLGPDLSYGGDYDAFVAKVNASGASLAYCGYIGEPDEDEGYGVAVDTAGSAYVVGYTVSNQPDFPVYIGPDLTHNAVGYEDGFIAKIVEEPLWKPRWAVGDFDGDAAEEVAVDFGGTGAWLDDNGTWSLLTAANPESLMAADVDGDSIDEVIADLGFTGLWLWNGGAWNQLSAVNVDCAAAGDIDGDPSDEVVGDFGPAGLWLYNNGSWSQLSGVNADFVAVADLDGAGGTEIIGDFGTTGLWLYGSGMWTQLSGVNADYLLTADTNGSGTDEIIADFAATGLWLWDSGNWTQDSGVDPDYMITIALVGSGGTACDFGALGLWLIGPGGWAQLSGVNPEYMIDADGNADGNDEILTDFGSLGMWMWKWAGGVWTQISPGNAE